MVLLDLIRDDMGCWPLHYRSGVSCLALSRVSTDLSRAPRFASLLFLLQGLVHALMTAILILLFGLCWWALCVFRDSYTAFWVTWARSNTLFLDLFDGRSWQTMDGVGAWLWTHVGKTLPLSRLPLGMALRN